MHDLAYAFGTVLGAYLMLVPLYLAGLGWNRVVAERWRSNPWVLPGLLCAVIAFGLMVQTRPDPQNPVMIAGFVPAVYGVVTGFFGYRRERRKANSREPGLS